MNKAVLILLSVVVFLLAAGGSYYYFSKHTILTPEEQAANENPASLGKMNNDYEALTFDPNAPKTEPCPLNGVKYGKDQEAWWQTHEPMGVMIENSTDARPQSGINAADVTYEAVAEGGITRTLNVFYCQDAGIIGPVRSARTYFLDYISEYANYPLYAHVGGANTPGPADALGQIDDYGWGNFNDLNQFAIGFPVYYRDETRLGHEAATEHTMYSVTNKLWAVGKSRGITNAAKGTSWDSNFNPYKFTDPPTASDRSTSQSIYIPWESPGYDVKWTYNPKDNLYYRENGGAPHIDRDTHKQLTAMDVIVLFETEKHAIDGYEGTNAHMLYGTTGTGDALVFKDGKEIKATWKKADRQKRTILTDASGNEITFTAGKLWFEILGIGSEVDAK